MRTQDFFTYDACRVCGQTPCNCTHIQESYEARPVKDRDDFLNRREFLYHQLNTPGLNKQDRDVIRHAIQDLEASARAAGLVKEDLRKWFKEKWVRFGPDGKIRGDCARGDDSEGKPKCLPQSKAHALGKKGRASAAARKRRQDPNPERKGKAINVATKEAVGNAPQTAAQVDYALYSDGKPSVKMSDRLLAYKFLAALKRRFPEQKHEIRTVQRVQEMKCSECGGPAFSDLLLAEKKDACYNKVRSRYKVWPSAYASGALVQCRKKGAANWGNKSKNEGVAEGSITPNVTVNKVHDDGHEKEWHVFRGKEMIGYVIKNQPDTSEGLYIAYGHGPGRAFVEEFRGLKSAVNYITSLKESVEQGVAEEQLDEKCWDTHRQVGMKNKGGKMVPNCVPKEGVAEGVRQLSIQQLATISDEALDKAYGYGRSTPGNSFGWQANLKSAAYAKHMIDKGVTDIEAISDAIHKGWNVTAQAFVKNPEQFDDTAKLKAAGKLEAKLQQRAQLMKQNYAQLPEEEKEKDRVVARALLQAIKGQQGVPKEGKQPASAISAGIAKLRR